ncbi:hypothetical protein DESC_940007 [Desulfosarcina cetonica]|nr:hypothetical protein DESC_940007 [Desulfosarcina cetonica]
MRKSAALHPLSTTKAGDPAPGRGGAGLMQVFFGEGDGRLSGWPYLRLAEIDEHVKIRF